MGDSGSLETGTSLEEVEVNHQISFQLIGHEREFRLHCKNISMAISHS